MTNPTVEMAQKLNPINTGRQYYVNRQAIQGLEAALAPFEE